jgi:CubicO group peptidase (beta-lactamase class C family)
VNSDLSHKYRFALLLLWLAGAVCGQGLPTAPPVEVGLSQEGLDRLTAVMQQHVDEHKVAGAVALIARHGKVAYFKGCGMRDLEAGTPMATDAIFRIASMTKPITSVAVMVLHDEGRLALADPVSKFIPEFKDAKVLAEDGTLVPAKREITIEHLLTHTSGLTYHWNPRLGERYSKAGITHGLLQDEGTLATKIPLLAQQPLLFQPGEKWEYGLSIDVLGRVVEVASGMPFDEFLRKRLLEPLRMPDTCFFLAEQQVPRLAAVHGPDGKGGLKRHGDEPLGQGAFTYTVAYPYKGPRTYFSGGGGLCSTAADYARFAQMMLNRGELDGVRVLRSETVDLMTTDHVGKLGNGFGLGFSVAKRPPDSSATGPVGPFGWGGFWYTTFFVDPTKDLVGVFMAQLHPAAGVDLQGKFRELTYQAIVE